ncbi:MAG: trypsin-like peptidase domain-containing protein [Phycisphaerales bacterium]|nr:trypsin-like peptidase domain-containing protein [Phycisphaerales bacterium]
MITIQCLVTHVQADTVILKSGTEIKGEVIKQSATHLWIDIGHDVIPIDMIQVENLIMDDVDSETVSESQPTLFKTSDSLLERIPQSQATIVGPSVIKVSTPGGLGSGVMINEDGFAITNAHVIQGETDLEVTVWLPQEDGSLQRTTIEEVEIIAINNHLDLALLSITHPEDIPFDFSFLEKAESIVVGQPVFAIGNPLGLERSMSQGVISTKQRSFDGLTYIQTDAAVNPGNSGGPLFNTKGEVVGITNMGITAAESLNFAIPTRYVKDFINNREAFAYDSKNPNSGHIYHKPPQRTKEGISPILQDGTGEVH